MLNLYEVRHNWVGLDDSDDQGYIHVLVIATSGEHAIDLARSKFRFAAEKHDKDSITPYGDAFWKGLRASVLTEDVARAWVGELRV